MDSTIFIIYFYGVIYLIMVLCYIFYSIMKIYLKLRTIGRVIK